MQDLEHALDLAAPEQSRRPFRAASAELWRLLRRQDDLRVRHAWLTDSQADGPVEVGVPLPRSAQKGAPPLPGPGLIVEPLTDKEREVLVHLSELLSTQEIAASMFISVNTVRTHVRNILRKLAASRRNEAVRRARELGLVPA